MIRLLEMLLLAATAGAGLAVLWLLCLVLQKSFSFRTGLVSWPSRFVEWE